METMTPTERDTRLALAGSRALARLIAQTEQEEIHLRPDSSQDNEITLPTNLARLIHDVLKQVGKGQAVVVLPVDSQLTTSEAAKLIGVSRPFLVELLTEGAMPYSLAGTHRRIRLADVLAYQQERERRFGVMESLVAETEALDLYL